MDEKLSQIKPIDSDSKLKQRRKNQKDGAVHHIIIISTYVVGAIYLLAFIIWMINLITPWIFLNNSQFDTISGLFIGSTVGSILLDRMKEIFRDHDK